jgi:multicomponent Na+:H+ antiporter subunit D
MINALPPAVILILGALPVPFLRGKAKAAWMLLLPVVSFINLLAIPAGTHWTAGFMGYELVFGQIDRLSLIFGYIFHLISFISILYALHVEDDVQNVAGLIYAGAALGVTFAGDFFSLFVFWEVLTISATFLILARRTPAALGRVSATSWCTSPAASACSPGSSSTSSRPAPRPSASSGSTDWPRP